MYLSHKVILLAAIICMVSSLHLAVETANTVDDIKRILQSNGSKAIIAFYSGWNSQSMKMISEAEKLSSKYNVALIKVNYDD